VREHGLLVLRGQQSGECDQRLGPLVRFVKRFNCR
jgi:hypothetical protein